MLKIYSPRYKYDDNGEKKLTGIIPYSEIVSIAPSEHNKNYTTIVVKSYPGTTSHWQGALSISTRTVSTYESFEDVVKQVESIYA